MIMLGSARYGEAESLYSWTTPRDLGGVTTCIYVVVPDADEHCLHARNQGAVVVNEPHVIWVIPDAVMRRSILKGICGASAPMILGAAPFKLQQPGPFMPSYRKG